MKNMRLSLNQTQKMLISPKLQHAIKLLQLSSIELAERIENELGENPFLEEEGEGEGEGEGMEEKEEKEEKGEKEVLGMVGYMGEGLEWGGMREGMREGIYLKILEGGYMEEVYIGRRRRTIGRSI